MRHKSLSSALTKAVLVVAHPDDEILWFSSLLQDVAKIVICYGEVPGQPEWSAGRAAVKGKFPLDKAVFLNITESVAFGVANWNDPVETVMGLQLDRPEVAFSGFSAERYEQNFDRLCDELEPILKGYSTVVTHNPWGEYGHEEHVQVYRAVRCATERKKQDIWYSNYVSDRSAVLMTRTLARSQEYLETLTTRPDLAAPIEKLYREEQCWTWPYDDYEYFATETFVLDRRQTSIGAGTGNRLPLNYLDVDGARARAVATPGISTLRKKIRRWRAAIGL